MPETEKEAVVPEATDEGRVPETKATTFDEGYVKKLRAEAAESRTKVRELTDRLQTIEDAEKTELEKATSRAEVAEKTAVEAAARANEAVLRAAVVQEATKQKAVDPEAVLAMIDRDAVTLADTGEVSGLEQEVTRLLEDKPYLLAATPGPSGGGIRESKGEMGSSEWQEMAKNDPMKFIAMTEAGKVPADALAK